MKKKTDYTVEALLIVLVLGLMSSLVGCKKDIEVKSISASQSSNAMLPKLTSSGITDTLSKKPVVKLRYNTTRVVYTR